MSKETGDREIIDSILRTIPYEEEFYPLNPWLLSSQINDRPMPSGEISFNSPYQAWQGNWYSTNNHRYLVDSREWTRGGMGFLHRAWDSNLNRMGMVKFVVPPYGQNDLGQLEALTMGRILHPNVMPVIDFMKNIEMTSGTFDCFVMPFVDCDTVSRLNLVAKAHQSSIPVRESSYILETTGWTLTTLRYQYGISHRDIKPANLLIRRDIGTLLITDFGYANTVYQLDEGNILGTPLYMLPEVASGRETEIKENGDVYSLGLLAYELLTGRWPYSEILPETSYQALSDICSNYPILLSSLAHIVDQIGPELTYALDQTIMTALEKDESLRQQTIYQFLSELIPLLAQIPVETLSFIGYI